MGSCMSSDTATYDPYKIPTPEHYAEQETLPSVASRAQSQASAAKLPSIRTSSVRSYSTFNPSFPASLSPPENGSSSQQRQASFSAVSAAPSLQHSVKMQEEPEAFESNYTRDEDLGVGAFAQVFAGTHKVSQYQYAVKKIDRSKMHWGDRDALEDEISNLTLVREGPNIVQLYEVYREQDDCYLVMEWMKGGELFDRILEKRTFTEKEARDVCRCMLNALDYMHQRRVAHRDLKPENLLLASNESDASLKLADFGFAKKVTTTNGCRTLCGTPGYLAPEILERWPSYDTKCDLWSVGVILFLLLGGYLPFDDDDEGKVFDRTRNGEFEFYPDYWNNVSGSAKNLVTKLLTVNPAKRANAQVALEHTWMLRTDEALAEKKLPVDHLQATIRKTGKEKMKAAVRAVMVMDRMQKLNEDFDSYLRTRSDSVSVFSVAAKMTKAAERPKVEDSASGKSFSHFYEVGELLGEGGFGTVRRITHKKTGEVRAVKIVHTTKLPEGGEQALKDEIIALKLLRGGPHIVRLYDVFYGKKRTYLIMEEMKGGELLQRIVQKEVYTEREARAVCEILFSAVDYCHKKKIAHRDLKPENLLLTDLDDDTTLKIADFGFAKKVTKPNSLSTLCGTANYVAPEVLDLSTKGYDHRADMWSLGVIVYILLGGYAPFEGPAEELANMILRGEYHFHDRYWMFTSTDAKDLISSLLQVNPNLRITAEEALQSDWMTLEAETLTGNDLSVAQEHIRSTLPMEKLKGAVHTVILTNKWNSLGNSFTGTLGSADSIVRRQEQRGLNRVSLTPINENGSDKDEDSSSGKPFLDLYEVGAQIGTGVYSIVVEGVYKRSQEEYAIKCVDRRSLHPNEATSLIDEISALKEVVDCPQIVRLHDVFDEPDTSYLVLERMSGGDLIERIISKAHYTEADAREVCKTLLLGIQFCHKRKIAIRNVTPENLLLKSEESDVDVKICDLGYAKKVLFHNSLRTQCGTEGYVAPEILEHRPSYGVKCDMWSLGVILYILLGGYRPFRGSGAEIMKQIRYGDYTFHPKFWGRVSSNAIDLIRQLMTVDPDQRISASKALKSSWIIADGSKLQSDLSESQRELKTFKGKEKLRQVVQMIIATSKLQSLGAHYWTFEDF